MLAMALGAAAPTPSSPSGLEVFDEATRIVADRFYDRSLRGLPWGDLVAEARSRLAPESPEEDLKEAVSGLLVRLQASHTAFYSDSDQTYWALASIFSHRTKGARVRQTGAWFECDGSRWFVRSVFEGSTAAAAGLLPGDEILSAAGAPLEPVRSFRTLRAALGVDLEIRRRPGAATRSVHVETRFESFQEVMLRATRRSQRLIERDGKTIGYFHLWAGTHPEFLAALRGAVRDFEARADAVVLDLRDGFGGAHPAYVAPFEELAGRESPMPVRHRFARPVVVVMNGGTRSGKEWVAYLLAKAGRTLVGTTTKGAFLGGRPYRLGGGKYMLFLAVSAAGPPGVDLEGKGVAPDIEVPQPLPYSAGADPQLDRALTEAARQAAGPP